MRHFSKTKLFFSYQVFYLFICESICYMFKWFGSSFEFSYCHRFVWDVNALIRSTSSISILLNWTRYLDWINWFKRFGCSFPTSRWYNLNYKTINLHHSILLRVSFFKVLHITMKIIKLGPSRIHNRRMVNVHSILYITKLW